jgi:hypothetical protein
MKPEQRVPISLYGIRKTAHDALYFQLPGRMSNPIPYLGPPAEFIWEDMMGGIGSGVMPGGIWRWRDGFIQHLGALILANIHSM